MKTQRPKTVFVLNHFQVAFFNAPGEQVPEIQKKNLLVLLAEHAERCGYDMDGVTVETFAGNFQIQRTADGWRQIRI